MYSNSYCFCCKCVVNVIPPLAIRSYFKIQGILVIFWNTSLVLSNLKIPKSDSQHLILDWIFFILNLTSEFCLLLGLVVSCFARSELSTFTERGRGSSKARAIKCTLFLYLIGIGTNLLVYCFFWIYWFVKGYYFEFNDFAVILMICGLILTAPFATVYVSQFIQGWRMREAVRDCQNSDFD